MNKFEAEILFDIDKTLIDGSEGHKEAFREGIKKAYRIDASIDIIDHQGKTDRQIILEVLTKKGLEETEIFRELDRCMEAMADHFDSIKNSTPIKVLPGVPELLDEMEKENFLIGLVTGNLERIAKAKLERAGLSRHFRLGGFGSDDTDRTNLVRLAVRRAEENFGFVPGRNVFLFGDTPRDISAGREAGVMTFGVATGSYPKEELMAAGADFVIGDLKDTERIIEMILKRIS